MVGIRQNDITLPQCVGNIKLNRPIAIERPLQLQSAIEKLLRQGPHAPPSKQGLDLSHEFWLLSGFFLGEGLATQFTKFIDLGKLPGPYTIKRHTVFEMMIN